MLGGSSRTPAAALAAVALSAVGCADLIGLNNLAGSGGSGGSVGPGSGGANEPSGGHAGEGGVPGAGGTSLGGTSAGGATPGGGSGGESLGGGDGSGGGGNDCSLDEFNSASFTAACWDTFNDDALVGGYEVNEEEGILTMRPYQGRVWFDGDSGFLLYRELGGNFLVEVTFSVLDGQFPEEHETYPQREYVTGGLVAFPAFEALEDVAGAFTGYYAIKAGSMTDFGYGGEILVGFKPEYTVAGDDATIAAPLPDAGGWRDVSLRICRYGDVLWTGRKDTADPGWIMASAGNNPAGYDTKDETLPDLADSMYVGLVAEAWDWEAEDGQQRIVYSRATFSVPTLFQDCKE